MAGEPRIYFDNAATTPTDPRVRAAMAPYLDGCFGNPSSLHVEGRTARAAVENARRQVAALVGGPPGGVEEKSQKPQKQGLPSRRAESRLHPLFGEAR